jgi:hypothetical protein
MSYAGMPNVASHGAGRQGLREAGVMRRAPGGPSDMSCHFPAPQPHRVYCQPAAFHSVDGRDKQLLLFAYGSSRPTMNGH